MAWDTLGDYDKRREYDLETLLQNGCHNSTYQEAAQPTYPPRPQWQPPPPRLPTQEETRAKAESQKKRSEWLDWERLEEQHIRQCRMKVKTLESDIAAYNLKIEENRTKLADDIPYWWNVLASLTPRLSETEKNSLRRQNLDNDAAIRIKRVPLASSRLQLQRLEDELNRHRSQEELRLTRERYEKEQRDRLEREKAQAEAQRRYAEDLAKQRAEREARMKAANEEAARQQARWEAESRPLEKGLHAKQLRDRSKRTRHCEQLCKPKKNLKRSPSPDQPRASSKTRTRTHRRRNGRRSAPQILRDTL